MTDKTDKQIIVQTISKVNGEKSRKTYKKGLLLGKGGFANCYIYKNLQNDRELATKIIRKELLLNNSRTKIKLINQIKLHKSSHHENVVELYEAFEDQDNVYIFLELCQNQSMDNYIKNKKKLTVVQIQNFMSGIVKGLKYLHSQKIIHRDLKLANIFLDKDLNVKIGDFGLATKIEFKNQKKRTLCGTPNYIAPEILLGEGYSYQVDVWSIGVLLCSLFTGIPPFQTDDIQETYKRIKKCSYQFPENCNIPNQAKELIKRILQMNPAKRYTLDQILESQFMSMGKTSSSTESVEKTMLQKVVSMDQMSFMRSTKDMWKSQKSNADQAPKISQATRTYVDKFEESDILGYTLTNGFIGIKNKNQSLLYSKDSKVFIHIQHLQRDLIKKYDENTLPEELQLLTKRLTKFKYSIKQNTNTIPSKKEFVYVKRYIKQKDFSVFRLSNQTVHMKFQDGYEIVVSNKKNIWIMPKNSPAVEDTLENYLDSKNQYSKKKSYVKAIFEKTHTN